MGSTSTEMFLINRSKIVPHKPVGRCYSKNFSHWIVAGMDENLPSAPKKSMDENLPSAPKKRPAMPGAGRPKGSVTIADRSLRLQMATEAARLYPKVLAFWTEVLENEKKN